MFIWSWLFVMAFHFSRLCCLYLAAQHKAQRCGHPVGLVASPSLCLSGSFTCPSISDLRVLVFVTVISCSLEFVRLGVHFITCVSCPCTLCWRAINSTFLEILAMCPHLTQLNETGFFLGGRAQSGGVVELGVTHDSQKEGGGYSIGTSIKWIHQPVQEGGV